MTEPTPAEAKNGWTTETLTKYLADRKRAADEAFHDKKPKRQTRTISRRPQHG